MLSPSAVLIEVLNKPSISANDSDRDGFAKRYVLLQQELDRQTGRRVSQDVVYTRLPVMRLSVLQSVMRSLSEDTLKKLRADQAPWKAIASKYAQTLYGQSFSKRFDAQQFGEMLQQHMKRVQLGEHLSARARKELALDTLTEPSATTTATRSLVQLRKAEAKVDRMAYGERGSDSDEDPVGYRSQSDNESQDTSLFSSDESTSDIDSMTLEDVPNELQLDMSQLSDVELDTSPMTPVVTVKEETSIVAVTSPVVEVVTTKEEEVTPVDEIQMFKQWRTHELQCAREHYHDMMTPHVFAGVLHPEALLVDHGGVAVLQSHVSEQELLRLLWFITEPQQMHPKNRRRTLKFLKSSSASPVPIVVCSGSSLAQNYLDEYVLKNEDPRVRSLVLGPHSAAMRKVSPAMHLCHLGEALYLRWLLDGHLPYSPWHVALLMYTAQRMATAALLFGDLSDEGRAAQWMTSKVVGAGLWDDLKAKYNEVSQSLQQKFPQWKQTIGDQLQKYAQQATVAMQSAYGTAKTWSAELAQKYDQQFKPWLMQQYNASKQWSAELAQKYEQQFKPWLAQQYNERLKPAALNAWNSTREASRKLVQYASQARQYVMQHLGELVQRIKTDPRYAQLKEKLKALANEAKQSGVNFWEYIKRQLEEGKLQGQELLEKVRTKIRELQIRMTRGAPPDLTKAIAETPPAAVPPATPSSASTTSLNAYGAPENAAGELDVDFIKDYRNFTQSIRRPRAALPDVASSTVAPETPVRRSFFEPIAQSEQQQVYAQPAPESLVVDPLQVPPPLPPRDSDMLVEIPNTPPPVPPRNESATLAEEVDDMSKYMPTTWQSTPEASALDAERLSRDLNEAMNQVQWWLSSNDSSFYNPVVVSSTLSLMEQVRDGISSEYGGGKQHSGSNHNNPVYQLMMRGSVQQDDDARQLRRNQEIQRLVGLANLIMVEAFYGKESGANDSGTYARTVSDLLNRGVVSTNDLEDLMAFIEAIEDQQLQLDALRGPFDRSVAAAAEMRVSGRAYAHALYHDQLLHRARGALFSLSDRTEQEQRVMQIIHEDAIAHDTMLLKSVCNCNSGLVRSAVFHTHYMSPNDWCDTQLAEDIEQVLQFIDDKKSRNIQQALLRWRKQMLDTNIAKNKHNFLYDEQLLRLQHTAIAFNWLYAAGSMLQLTHEWDPKQQARTKDDTPHLSLTSTWNLFVKPALESTCQEHTRSGLFKHDALQLHLLDQEFYATLRALTKPTNADIDATSAKQTYFNNATQARAELGYFLYRCQPLDYEELPSNNQWHLLWEAITSVQVEDLYVPKQWITPKTPEAHLADPIRYWSKMESLEYNQSVTDIVRRLHRATELERRCARAHELRKKAYCYDISISTEPHLLHLQHLMRAQRCWAIRTLRTYPEHLRQYVLLDIESELGPLCQECLVPLSSDSMDEQKDKRPKSKTPSRINTSDIDTPDNIDTWDQSQKIVARGVSDVDISDMPMPMDDNATDFDYIKPVAFRSIYLDAENPTSVSVGAVMLEVHAARSWKEVAHIFASYGLLEHV